MEYCIGFKQQNTNNKNEKRTLAVIILTFVMMIAEIVYGLLYGSMALLADGIHMGTHTLALLITLAAYIFARRNRNNKNFSFGTGKVNSLAGFSSAILLLVTALFMIKEAVERFFTPIQIGFDESIAVAIIGLVVNVVSMVILGSNHSHEHEHGHKHEDHNIKAAYLHVLTDAITSVAAIFALVIGKNLGAIWLDPLVAIISGLLIIKWATHLIAESGKVLLDYHNAPGIRKDIINLFKNEGYEIIDFHLWNVDANETSLIIKLGKGSKNTIQKIKAELKEKYSLHHIIIEHS